MSKDLSRNALFVLVIIAVVVSILSTTFVMNAIYLQEPSRSSPVASAKARIVVSGTPLDSGKVVLTVVEKNGK